jgi:site-specific recombinase XerD
MNCRECQKPEIYKGRDPEGVGLCHQCYQNHRGRKRLEKMEKKFKPASRNNGFIFKKYVESLNGWKISGEHLNIAKLFSKYLKRHPVRELRNWNDVRAVSKEANIRLKHRHNLIAGCPVMRVGRILAREGLIEPREKAKFIDRSIRFRSLSEPLKSLVKEYYNEITETHRARHCLSILSCIGRWEEYLGPTSIFEATREQAVKFIDEASRCQNVAHIWTIRCALRSFYIWLIKNGHHTSLNPFIKIRPVKLRRTCSICNRQRTFSIHNTICNFCVWDKISEKQLRVLEEKGQALPGYARDLFNLHLKYIRRYHVQLKLIRVTNQFFDFLQSKGENIEVLRSWAEVVRLSKEFKTFKESRYKTYKTQTRCPVQRVGCILQELGVIPIREVEGLLIDYSLKKLGDDLTDPIRQYADVLRKGRRRENSVASIVSLVTHFNTWLTLNTDSTLWLATEKMAIEYLLSLPKQDSGNKVRTALGRFYSWAKSHKYTLYNPFENIPRAESPKKSLQVCSPEQVKKLESFIKNPNSDPELAMILALSFYWGFGSRDLALSTVEFEDSRIKIIFYRDAERYCKRKYRRNQILLLPAKPNWLLNLQKRYILFWRERFKKVRGDLPRHPLILSKGRHNRPLHTLAIQKRFSKATVAAAGVRIPPNVVRRTGADVYSQQVDPAILPRFGWSKSRAFVFTWMPREYYRLNK